MGKEYGIPTMMDLGSGCLVDLAPFGLAEEITVQEVLAKGVDVVSFSGDKLLGGPQAGILAGRAHLSRKCAQILLRVPSEWTSLLLQVSKPHSYSTRDPKGRPRLSRHLL